MLGSTQCVLAELWLGYDVDQSMHFRFYTFNDIKKRWRRIDLVADDELQGRASCFPGSSRYDRGGVIGKCGLEVAFVEFETRARET